MIPRTPHSCQTAAWQQALAAAISDPAALLRYLELPAAALPLASSAARTFPLRVPQSYARRMCKGDPHDPLLLQVWPHAEEERPVPGFRPDPVGDLAAMPVPGLLHKYRGRVLLVLTGACGIHCRYCFRRHFPYPAANPARNEWSDALRYLERHSEVNEVILSGGDPLLLSDARLARLAQALERIPHVRRLRVHTRLPVLLPERVDEALLGWLSGGRLKPVMVVHVNHANEIDADIHAAMQRLAAQGVTLLNQAVLLHGINDTVEAQAALSEALFESGIMPYYLHLLDRVDGAAHFEVPERDARQLLGTLQNRLPGYLVPRMVREEPGRAAKRPVAPTDEPVATAGSGDMIRATVDKECF